MKYFQYLIIILVATSVGCEDPELVGLGTLPDTEGLNIESVDTFTVKGSYHIQNDLVTANLNSHTYLIGGMNDPIFGKVSSTLYTQFALGNSSLNIGTAPVVDSVVVYLKYAGSYGWFDRLRGYQHMKVFELAEDLVVDSAYTQNSFHAKGEQRASFGYGGGDGATVIAPFGNNLTSDTLSLQPHLRIKLDNTLGEKILGANLTDNESLAATFKGLIFEPQVENLDVSTGAIYYYDVQDGETRMRIYFHNEVSGENDYKILDLFIGQTAATHTSFHHEYPESFLQDTANPTVGEQTLYVQSMGGVYTKLSFPGLLNLKKDANGNPVNIAINKAELILPIESSNFSDLAPPIFLLPLALTEDTTLALLSDESDDQININGIFNQTTLEYRFNVARQLQWFMYNNVSSPEIYIFNRGSSVNGYRGVLNGTEHPLRPIKLQVSFTRIE